MMRRATGTGLALAAVVALSAAGEAQTIAIVGGRVFPVSGPVIENGTVLIRDGKIVAVGASVTIPADAQRIDATGQWVTPGLVNPQTELGVVEVGAVVETRDAAARQGTDRVAAAFRVWDGMNPQSVLLAPARDEGVTTVAILPQGGLIAGQAALVDLVPGAGLAEMLIKSPIAMIGQIQNPPQANTQARGELMVRLRELLEDTRAFLQHRADYERAQTRQYVASRLDLEAMAPVLRGQLPLVIEADRASDIEAALKLARDYGLKIIIGGGSEAWMVADKLAAAGVPVMAGSLNNIPTSFNTLGARQENPALLRKAGVTVLLIGTGSDPDAFNVRNIRQEAGNAVAYGMTWDEALRSVTLAPAEVFGAADRIGSLRPGRDGDVVVWNGDPFEFGTVATHVLIRGRPVRTGDSRQDQLMRRYRTLPPTYRRP